MKKYFRQMMTQSSQYFLIYPILIRDSEFLVLYGPLIS